MSPGDDQVNKMVDESLARVERLERAVANDRRELTGAIAALKARVRSRLTSMEAMACYFAAGTLVGASSSSVVAGLSKVYSGLLLYARRWWIPQRRAS
jgi:hypothetical protein